MRWYHWAPVASGALVAAGAYAIKKKAAYLGLSLDLGSCAVSAGTGAILVWRVLRDCHRKCQRQKAYEKAYDEFFRKRRAAFDPP